MSLPHKSKYSPQKHQYGAGMKSNAVTQCGATTKSWEATKKDLSVSNYNKSEPYLLA